MKTVRELINEADAKGYDVNITDDEATWDRQLGHGWMVWGEGWYHDEHDFDHLPVTSVEESHDDKQLFITVEGMGK